MDYMKLITDIQLFIIDYLPLLIIFGCILLFNI
jgi:hypothetical protein